MCDYSLHTAKNRLAHEGESLVTFRFPTRCIGLASPADITALEEWGTWRKTGNTITKLVKTVTDFFKPQPAVCAVCLPPGARLTLGRIPANIRNLYSVGKQEVVTFDQRTAAANQYRDSVRFQNGTTALLQELPEGIEVVVISLDGSQNQEEAQKARQRGVVAAR